MSADLGQHFDNLDSFHQHFEAGDLFKYKVTKQGLVASGPLSRRVFKILPAQKAKVNFNTFATASLKELKSILKEISPKDSKATKKLKERIETVFKHLSQGELSEELKAEKKEVEALAREFEEQTADDSFHEILSFLQNEEVATQVEKSPPFTFSPSTLPVDPRLLFHIHGDALGEGTGLEGQSPLTSLAYLLDFLKSRPQFNSERVAKTLKNADELANMISHLGAQFQFCQDCNSQKLLIEKFANELGRAIDERLERGEPVGFIAGWSGSPVGHAIFMEITKEGADDYVVRLYNTGLGIDGDRTVAIDYKEKNLCFEEYRGVKREDLFNPSLLKALVELVSFPKDPTLNAQSVQAATPTRYGPEDIYSGIVKLLKGKRSSPSYQLEDLMGAQRAGTCTWKSLCAYMRRNLTRAEYKRFKFEIKLQSLHQFYESERDQLDSDLMKLTLFQRCTEKFAREVLKLYQEKPPIINAEEFLFLRSWIGDLALKIDEARSVNQFRTAEGSKISKLPVSPIRNLEHQMPPVEDLQQAPTSLSPSKAISKDLLEINSWVFDPKTIVGDLEKFSGLIQDSYSKGMHQLVINSINEIFKRLPSAAEVSQMLNGQPKEEIEKAIVQIKILNELLFKATLCTTTQEESLFSMLKGSVIAALLFNAATGIPFNAPLPPPPTGGGIVETRLSEYYSMPQCRNMNFHFADVKMQMEFESLSSIHSNLWLNRMFKYQDFEGRASGAQFIQITEDMGSTFETAFVRGLLADKDFMAEAERKSPGFMALDEGDQIRQLLTSDSPLVPPAFLAIREQACMLDYLLLRSDGGNQSSTNLQDFSIKFGIDPNWNAFPIYTITGLSMPSDIGWGYPTRQFANAKSRFENLHRPFTNPNFTKLLEIVSDPSFSPMENYIVALNFKLFGIDLPKEECVAILSCLVSSTFQPYVTLGFFEKNIDKLNDPDYQTLFEIIMLERDFLPTVMKRDPRFNDKLEKFVNRGFERAKGNGNLHAALFFHRLNNIFSTYPGYNNELDLKSLSDLVKTEEDKNLLYLEKVASYLHKDDLTEGETADLLSCKIHLSTHLLKKEKVDPKILADADKALLKWAHKIDEKILNAVLHNIGFKEDSGGWRETEFPLWQSLDGQYSINIILGTLHVAKKELGVIPLEMRLHDTYKYFFEEQSFQCEFIDPMTSTFQDARGDRFFLRMNGNDLTIQREIEGRLFRFVPKNYMRAMPFFPLALSENFDHWRCVDDPSLMWCVDHEKGEPAYEVTLSDTQVTQVTPFKEKDLHLCRTDEFFVLNRIENPRYVLLWENQNELKRADLPRYNLHFDVVESSNKWQLNCREFPGYHLATSQVIEGYENLYGSIILENDRGEKKVLVPKQELSMNQAGALFPVCLFDDQSSTSPKSQQYCIFEVDDKNRLHTRRIDDSLRLALIHLALHKYEEAFSYLKEKGSQYTDEESRLLDSIIKSVMTTKDHFSDALAVRLHAKCLKLQNEALYGKTPSIERDDSLEKEYRKYLNLLNNVSHAVQLSPKEELAILERIPLDAVFARRKKEITGVAQSYSHERVVPSPRVQLWKNSENLNFNIDQTHENSTLSTRWGVELITNLQKYYELALTLPGTPERKEFLERLLFAKNDPDERVKVIASVLEIAAEHRDLFPPFDPDVARFISQIISIARDLDTLYTETKVSLPPAGSLQETAAEKPSLGPIPISETSLPPLTILSDLVDQFFTKRVLDASVQRKEVEETIRGLESAGKAVAEDLRAFRDKLKETLEYQIEDPEGLTANLSELQKHLDENSYKIEELLLSIANKEALTAEERAHDELSLQGKKRKTIGMNDVILCFTRGDFIKLREMNPRLSESDIASIKELLKEFLVERTLSDQAARALALSNPQEMANCLLAKREYNIDEHPEFIVFEYFSDLLLREDQVKKLQALLSDKSDGLVLQMIMGSGKSKVLLPILGIARADGSKLSTVIVSDALYHQTVDDLRNNPFSQSIMTLEFGRKSSDTVKEFLRILKILNETIDEKKVLITTSKTLQSIYLKALESFKVDPLSEKSILLKKILKKLKEQGHAIIDEVDEALSTRKENNYSFGKSHPLEQERLELSSFLYEAILEEEGNFEFLTSSKGPAITDEYYHTVIKPHLVKKLQERWGDQDQNLFDYLMGKPQDPSYVDTIEERKKRNLLALAKEQLNVFLPLTIKKNCDENYGFDQFDVVAIPYASSNTPLKGTQFGAPYESVNYTIQANLKKGISKNTFINVYRALQESAMRELREKEISLEESESYEIFARVTNGKGKLSMLQISDDEVDRFVASLNETPQAKLRFITQFILPKIEIYDQKFSSNPHDLCDLFANVQGFTGTLWNAKSFPTRMRPMREVGTDARTLATLWKNSKEAIVTTDKTDPKDILKELQGASAFIDTGGVLRGYDNKSMAKEMLRGASESIKGVVYFDDENHIVILERGNDKPTPLEESTIPLDARMTLYDQKHTTGADIPQKSDAVGIVTIGPHTFLRDILQSVWRLRKLEGNQRAQFLITPDVKDLILKACGKEGEVELSDIINFCMQNQVKRENDDNFNSMRQKMHHILAKRALELLMDGKVEFKDVESLFFHSTEDRPYETYGAQQIAVPIDEAISHEVAKWENWLKTHPDFKITENFQSVVDRAGLPDLVLLREGLNTNLEAEVAAEREREIENVAPPQMTPPDSSWNNMDLVDKLFYGADTIDEIFSKNPALSKFQNVFSSNLRTARNFHTSTALSDKQMNFYGLLYNRSGNEYEIILMDIYEARLLYYLMTREPDQLHDYRAALVQSNVGMMATSQSEPTRESELNDPRVKYLLIQAKFLQGEVNYNKEEIELLRSWIQEKGPSLLKELFEEHILKFHPEAKLHFPASSLGRLFSEFLPNSKIS